MAEFCSLGVEMGIGLNGVGHRCKNLRIMAEFFSLGVEMGIGLFRVGRRCKNFRIVAFILVWEWKWEVDCFK